MKKGAALLGVSGLAIVGLAAPVVGGSGIVASDPETLASEQTVITDHQKGLLMSFDGQDYDAYRPKVVARVNELRAEPGSVVFNSVTFSDTVNKVGDVPVVNLFEAELRGPVSEKQCMNKDAYSDAPVVGGIDTFRVKENKSHPRMHRFQLKKEDRGCFSWSGMLTAFMDPNRNGKRDAGERMTAIVYPFGHEGETFIVDDKKDDTLTFPTKTGRAERSAPESSPDMTGRPVTVRDPIHDVPGETPNSAGSGNGKASGPAGGTKTDTKTGTKTGTKTPESAYPPAPAQPGKYPPSPANPGNKYPPAPATPEPQYPPAYPPVPAEPDAKYPPAPAVPGKGSEAYPPAYPSASAEPRPAYPPEPAKPTAAYPPAYPSVGVKDGKVTPAPKKARSCKVRLDPDGGGQSCVP